MIVLENIQVEVKVVTVKELREKLNTITDDKILNMDIMLEVNNTLVEDMIMDFVFEDNSDDNPEESEELYSLLRQFSQYKLTDICTKEDLFSASKEDYVYLIADMNNVD